MSEQTRPRSPRRSSSRTRWVAPTVAAVVAAAGIGYGTLGAGAADGLPERSAQDILTGMQQASVPALSGTVVAKADLGLPDLPGMSESAEFTSLVSGSHTMRVWYDGPEKVRVAKLGEAGETDLVRNGRDAWVWSSAQKKAVHHVLPADTPAGHARPGDAATMPATPQEASEQILAHLSADSTVSTSSVSRVAGRPVYELVLTPKQQNTLVKDVRLAVDGETMIPLRVQVYSTRLSAPAYEVGFSSLELGDVEDRMFTFTPPAGTSVETRSPASPHGTARGGAAHPKAHGKGHGTAGSTSAHEDVQVVGEGWSRIHVLDVGEDALEKALAPQGGPDSGHPHRRADAPDLGAIVSSLPQTSGAWGSGRVLEGTLFSAVLTDDGRLATGAVPAAQLTAALSTGR